MMNRHENSNLLKPVRKRVNTRKGPRQSAQRIWQQREPSGFDPTEVIDGEFDNVDLDTVLRDIEFSDRMSDKEAILWERCYLPWSRQLSCEIASGIPGTRWLQMVVDIVVENEPLEAIEQKYRLGGGMALGFLVSGLDRYIEIRREMPW